MLATWHFISSGPAADSSTSGLIIMAELVDCKVMYLESDLRKSQYFLSKSNCTFMDFFHEETADSSSFRNTIQLAPMPDSYDLDRGLLLSVQAIQVIEYFFCLFYT